MSIIRACCNKDVYTGEQAIPPQQSLVKRVALASIPFLMLHPPCRTPVGIGINGMRLYHSQGVFARGVSLCALIGGLVNYRLGMGITAIHDLLREIKKLPSSANREEAFKSLVKISHLIVLVLFFSRGGLELALLFSMLQAAMNLIQSRDEFKKGRWLEGVANLVMMGIRLDQSRCNYQKLQRHWEIQAAIKRIYVGELRDKWKFPSDHLPVGVEVNGVKIISWNVLNTKYIDWVIDKDTQGLKGSLISDLNTPVNAEGLTQRDVLVAQITAEMMKNGDIIALQECGKPFLKHLQESLPEDWKMVKSFQEDRHDQDVLIFNTHKFNYDPSLSETSRTAYPTSPGRPLQNIHLTQSGTQREFQIINAHIPGDPALPGRDEFARYVNQHITPGKITVALGDKNFERGEMLASYNKAGVRGTLYSPYKTNIGIDKISKAIDHILCVGQGSSRALRPNELVLGHYLPEMVHLLNTPSPAA